MEYPQRFMKEGPTPPVNPSLSYSLLDRPLLRRPVVVCRK
jgi:hypothetical protein